ncbi:MAG: 50S ribosomal protein L18 [Clostridiales bacterium]|nr:50S ribosomal protein L18 [Clostridiales bacterium]
MIKKTDKNKLRRKKHLRIRKNINGTSERPRLNVYKSAKHIYAQVIDDSKGITLVSASTLDSALKDKVSNGGNIEAAKAVGQLVAERAVEQGVKIVVFDRGGYIYHGRIKELADAARANGLKF